MPKLLHTPYPLGHTIGEWIILDYESVGALGGVVTYITKCSCGNVDKVDATSLRKGRSTRCNPCAKGKATRTRMASHGHQEIIRDTTTRFRWQDRYSAMRSRCYTEGSSGYKDYGGRGITICDEWLDKRQFLSDIKTLEGWDDPKYEIDRIDNDGPYALWNCRLVDRSGNNSNKRTTRWVEYDGERMSATEFWKQHAPAYQTLGTVARKIREGLSADQIIQEQAFVKGPYCK